MIVHAIESLKSHYGSELQLGYGSIPIDTFLVGWTSIYQLFWCSPGVQGFDPSPIQGKPRLKSRLFAEEYLEVVKLNPENGIQEELPKGEVHESHTRISVLLSEARLRRNDTLRRTWRRLPRTRALTLIPKHSCSFSILVEDKTFESCSFLDAHLLEKDASWWFGLCVQVSDGHDRIRLVDN